MTKRFLRLDDMFEVKCKNCKSTDIDLMVDECDQCGNSVSAYCNFCHKSYSCHNFKMIEEND